MNNAILTDSVIYEALRDSIAKAFFTPVTVYDSYGNITTSYGGQAYEVVQKVLQSPRFIGLQEVIVGEIAEREEEFRSIVETEWRKKIAQSLDIIVGKHSYNSYQDIIDRHLRKCAEMIVQEELQDNPALHEKIRQQVTFENYTLRINVNVTVEPAPEVAKA
jgi:hypothetical protein